MPPSRLRAALRCTVSCSRVGLPAIHFRVTGASAGQSSIEWQRTFNIVLVRHASHQSQGRANGPKNSPGKRLGAKKTGGQQVVPGNIIFRQRGTHWFPGENCSMGRDHTIHATQPGYVRYYRDPLKHPKRKYIGVVFDKTQTLPTPPNAARRRRLGMVAVPRPLPVTEEGGSAPVASTPQPLALPTKPLIGKIRQTMMKKVKEDREKNLKMSSNYMFRESNREIGRTAEKEGIYVRPYHKKDRWLAWRKRTARRARAAEKRRLGARGGKERKAKRGQKRK